MTSLKGKIALVTGASAGIGLANAEALAKHGAKVFACARNIQAIEDLSARLGGDGVVHAVKCDMTKEDQVMALFQKIRDKYGKIDILINNAGMGGAGTGLLNGEFDNWKTMLDLNILGLTLATREAVKLIESSGSQGGHIININSGAGHRVPSDQKRVFYSGTKHMLLALTEGLRKSVQAKNIRVTSVSPGITETEFGIRAYGKEEPERAAQMYKQFKCLEAKDISDAIVYALTAPAHVNIDEITISASAQVRP